jgi:dimethylhistidine N-methyltransferase
MNEEFAQDIRHGLSLPQKELPSKYLYDAVGSALFEAITVLPEYGLTRADACVLRQLSTAIPKRFRAVAELGCGTGQKVRPLLHHLRMPRYFPIDISETALALCVTELSTVAEVTPLRHSYLDGLRAAREQLEPGEPLLVLFIGSTIGNFTRPERGRFLSHLRAQLQPGDALLLGCDLVKPLETMLLAYDDPAGVTAAFNLNLLGRINRELGADFVLRHFEHQARYHSGEDRVEMHLRSRIAQKVTIPAAGFACNFEAGETIWTESSHKFRAECIPTLAGPAGFTFERQWVASGWPFSESLWNVSY